MKYRLHKYYASNNTYREEKIVWPSHKKWFFHWIRDKQG